MHIHLQQNAAQESVGDMRDTSQLTISHCETALMQEHQELWNQKAQEISLTS